MIARSPRVSGLDAVEIPQIEMVDVGIDDTRRIVVSDVIIETSRKKCLLRAILALNEPGHAALRHHAERLNLFAFPHSHSQ